MLKLVLNIRCKDVDWIVLVHDTVQWQVFVKTIKNIRVYNKAGNLLTNWATISFSRRKILLHVITY